MISYPYHSIFLNRREIKIQDILSEKVQPNSDFEFTTLQFIQEWLKGVGSFEIKTSGSTGAPKIINISRGQMIHSSMATEKALELKSGYRALICLDTQSIAGKMMIVRSFCIPMQMDILEPQRNPLANRVQDHEIDFAAFVPYQIEEILESKEAFLFNSIKTTIIGGAPLNPSTSQKLNDYACHFYTTYGMTETISHVALHRVNTDSIESVFETLPGIKIETDDRGCLVIKVPYLPEKVITNDVVEIISEKNFRWIGRWDNIINTGGIKVNPEKIEFQIEKIFTRLNFKRRFFVGGLPDTKTGQRVTLFIEGESDDDLLQEIENRLKSILERFERPKKIVFIPRFHNTRSNKLHRIATVKAYLGG